MSKFKVGDRVAIYSSAYRYVGVVKAAGTVCQVLVGDNPVLMFYHSKQLRLLRLKPKRERLEMHGTFTRADKVPADNRGLSNGYR